MRRYVYIVFIVGVISVFALTRAYPDKVYLKNGRSIEGIISERTQTHVILDIGAGSITLPNKDIERIDEYDMGKQKELKSEWSSKYFLNPDFIPQGLNGLADRFQRLSSLRQKTVEKAEKKEMMTDQIQQYQRESAQLKEELAKISKVIVSINPEDDINRYNELVSESNVLSSKIRIAAYNEDKLAEQVSRLDNYCREYTDFLEDFKESFRKLYDFEKGSGSPREEFLLAVKNNLDNMDNDFIEHSASYKRSGGNLIVEAVINNDQKVDLVVDTGASMVAISKKVIDRMGLNIDDNPVLSVTVADGRTVEAKQIVLESLRVGNAEVKNVFAAVLDNPTKGQTDGLLGMSFLGNFSVKINSASNEMVLESFKP